MVPCGAGGAGAVFWLLLPATPVPALPVSRGESVDALLPKAPSSTGSHLPRAMSSSATPKDPTVAAGSGGRGGAPLVAPKPLGRGTPVSGVGAAVIAPAPVAARVGGDTDDGGADARPAAGDELVIVVEDEATLRRLAERMLGRIGLRTAVYEDGSDLTAGAARGASLVLMDIVMKRSDGVHVRLLRAAAVI